MPSRYWQAPLVHKRTWLNHEIFSTTMTLETFPSSDVTYRIEVFQRSAEGLVGTTHHVATARQLGYTNLTRCVESRLYFLRGDIPTADVRRLCEEVLADPITEAYKIISVDCLDCPAQQAESESLIEVTLLPGVTDPAAENLLRAAQILGINALERAATGQCYLLDGDFSISDLHGLATEVFCNPVIQRYAINARIEPPFFEYQHADDTVEVVSLRSADDAALLRISSARRLALDLAEMQAIQSYYLREDRDPTDVELEMLAQTWSEHCVHKTFKALIDFRASADDEPLQIDGLLRTYIRAATERVQKPWVRSAFVDNAGIVAFDDHWDLAFKVETHNHPSALEPFGGANTGVGGVIRDVLGVSARPIANTDVLCFGPQNLPHGELPSGVLHPLVISDGVVRGVEDYGNKMGIPTVNGAILYHAGYTANPLVFVGCLGILPRGSHPSTPRTGDLIIVIGGRTGRDGLRGATFSSMEMDQATSDIAGSAVQIGHPIHEKQTQEVIIRARDERLYHALTDCGAGGLSSAVGEIGKDLGVRVQLDSVPLKYPGLRPWEIWLSEAQERMVLAVPPGNWARLQEICAGQSIEAVCIGNFERDGRLHLLYGEHVVADIEMDFLHNGIPRRHLQASLLPTPVVPLQRPQQELTDYSQPLLKLLSHPNIRSKEQVIRLYDHEVQGATAIKPLTGVANHGPSDAAVLVPINGDAAAATGLAQTDAPKGAAIGAGICPEYTEHDPYAMAWAAIDEAMRNIVCVGADPDQVSLLDNFCWGNPNLPDRLGSLVRCVQGCFDAAIAFGAPFISGKDSLNNEYTAADGRKHAIPGTLLISALGIVPDATRTATMDLKHAGNLLYLIGDTRGELGGSHLALAVSDAAASGSPPPQPVRDSITRMRAIHRAIADELVQSCHDCSEGGFSVAMAEMCLAGRLGALVDITHFPTGNENLTATELLFSESLSRFIVEVAPTDAAPFESYLSDVPHSCIGQVTEGTHLSVTRGETTLILTDVSALETAWRGHVKGIPTITAAPQESVAYPRSDIPRNAMAPRQRRIMILHATGTNRDHDAALACELAGGQPEIVHVNQLVAGERNLLDYGMLVVPGGFSYGDDLGAGTLWAIDLQHRLADAMTRFVEDGRPVLGICNGFQALVKSGLLPGNLPQSAPSRRTVTLAPNERGHFECRWVYLKPSVTSTCIFTSGLDELIYCPVAHGEGRVIAINEAALQQLQSHHLIALTYTNAFGNPDSYPANPNGSQYDIAGLTNPAGNVLGLMPHPENHIFNWQHPRYRRGEQGYMGIQLFANGIRHM